MLVAVSEIADALYRQKRTCVLTLPFIESRETLKVFFKDGVIRTLALGRFRDTECLREHPGPRFGAWSLLDDPGEHVPVSKLSAASVLEHIKQEAWTARSGPDGFSNAVLGLQEASPQHLHDLEETMVNAAGPVARIILDECRERIGLQRGGRLSRGVFRQFVRLVTTDLPVDDRTKILGLFGSGGA